MTSSNKARSKLSKSKKKKFSSFTKKEAFNELGLANLLNWTFTTDPVQPSDFFNEYLDRLNRSFDLESYEESKKLLIDAICNEAIYPFEYLKIWKGAQLESDRVAGYVDYLIAARKRFLDSPMLCIIEAKKDDFEQGLAQCLVEMQACQWQNRQADHKTDILGIVTNGDGWRFYKLTITGEVYETSAIYGAANMAILLGQLRYIFQVCEQNLCKVTTL
jgi:hypothetical protein